MESWVQTLLLVLGFLSSTLLSFMNHKGTETRAIVREDAQKAQNKEEHEEITEKISSLEVVAIAIKDNKEVSDKLNLSYQNALNKCAGKDACLPNLIEALARKVKELTAEVIAYGLNEMSPFSSGAKMQLFLIEASDIIKSFAGEDFELYFSSVLNEVVEDISSKLAHLFDKESEAYKYNNIMGRFDPLVSLFMDNLLIFVLMEYGKFNVLKLKEGEENDKE